MTRVELNVRRLVVHGRERFDGEAFSAALRSEVAQRVGEANRLSSKAQAQGTPPQRQAPASSGLAGESARAVAGRLFR